MNSPTRRIAALALTLALALQTPLAAQERARVAVIDFENHTSWWQDELGGAAADRLTTDLVNANVFTMVEREMIDRILDEQGLQMSGAVDPEQVVEIGRLAGVDYVVVGSITSFSIEQTGGSVSVMGRRVGGSRTQAKSAVDVRAISTRDASIIAAAKGEGDETLTNVSLDGNSISQSSPYNVGLATEALAPAIASVVKTLAERAAAFAVPEEPLEPAKPATIVGSGSEEGQFYTDQGENFGVEVGARFNVMRVVDEIVDASGNVLDVVTERVGVLEITRVLSQSAIATLVEGAAQEGDTLVPVAGGAGA